MGSKVVWKQGKVVAVGLRDGSSAAALMLNEPYLACFASIDAFDSWVERREPELGPMFICMVTRQFLRFSDISTHSSTGWVPHPYPTAWIKPHPGTRRVTVWGGTDCERSFVTIGKPPGGSLVEKHIDAVGFNDPIVLAKTIALDDDATIDRHETTFLWTFPQLNERLLLCKEAGRSVDPLKDVLFDRALRPEYETFVKMLASEGELEDWGYTSPTRR